MAYTADGKKVRCGMKVYDRVFMSERTMTVQEVKGNTLKVNFFCGVPASTVYSTKEAVSIAERVLIFGGAFNPIHNGHLIACRALAEGLGIKEIILIPSGKHPYKHDITDGPTRIKMLELAIDEEESLFSICDCEFNREGFSYSVDTARWIKEELYKKMEEVYWMIGQDNVKEIPKWYRAGEFVKEVRFAVASRRTDNQEFEGTDEEKIIMNRMHLDFIDTPVIEISSSMIRERVKQGKSIKHLVPDKVEKYIRENNLYK